MNTTRRGWFGMLMGAIAVPLVAKFAKQPTAPPVSRLDVLYGANCRPGFAMRTLENGEVEALFARNARLPKIGDTIQVRRPPRFITKEPMALGGAPRLEEIDLVTIQSREDIEKYGMA